MARHSNGQTHQGRMAPLIAMLLAAAYAVDKIDTAPTPKKARHRSKEGNSTPPPPYIPRPPAIRASPTAIHPMFRQGILQDPKQIFRPALELASRFLTSDAFLGYCPITELSMPTRRDIANPPPGTRHFGFTAEMPTHLTRAQIAITDLALSDLANSITLDLRSPAPSAPEGAASTFATYTHHLLSEATEAAYKSHPTSTTCSPIPPSPSQTRRGCTSNSRRPSSTKSRTPRSTRRGTKARRSTSSSAAAT
ncbi:hypothetical protein LTR02_008307 [Friedmanniomyces endolithicus]|nr:hypothetical protein LTR02_008307 [Friedmanniomyces endolithicus]